MNPYPYFSYSPISIPISAPATNGIFKKIFSNGINWGNIINNTQKTLNIINQTIPVVKQVSPMVKNARTMFKVMSEFNKSDSQLNTKKSINHNANNFNNTKPKEESIENTIGPTFFT